MARVTDCFREVHVFPLLFVVAQRNKNYLRALPVSNQPKRNECPLRSVASS